MRTSEIDGYRVAQQGAMFDAKTEGMAYNPTPLNPFSLSNPSEKLGFEYAGPALDAYRARTIA